MGLSGPALSRLVGDGDEGIGTRGPLGVPRGGIRAALVHPDLDGGVGGVGRAHFGAPRGDT